MLTQSVIFLRLTLSAWKTCRQVSNHFDPEPQRPLVGGWPVTAHLLLASSSTPPACSRAKFPSPPSSPTFVPAARGCSWSWRRVAALDLDGWVWSHMGLVSHGAGLTWVWSHMGLVSHGSGLTWGWSHMGLSFFQPRCYL